MAKRDKLDSNDIVSPFSLHAYDDEDEREDGDADDGPGLVTEHLKARTGTGVLEHAAYNEIDQALDKEDDGAHESGGADGRGLAPGDEDRGEPGDDQDLLHGHGELGHRKRRAGKLGERTFLELLLGLGLIERKLAEFHVAGNREGDAGEDDGDDASIAPVMMC